MPWQHVQEKGDRVAGKHIQGQKRIRKQDIYSEKKGEEVQAAEKHLPGMRRKERSRTGKNGRQNDD